MTPNQKNKLESRINNQLQNVKGNYTKGADHSLPDAFGAENLATTLATGVCTARNVIVAAGKDIGEDIYDLLNHALDDDLADLINGLDKVINGLGNVLAAVLTLVVELVADLLLALPASIVDLVEFIVHAL